MKHIAGYLVDLHKTLDEIPLSLIQKMVDVLLEARMNDKQVFVMGNGGSASTSSHFVADLGKNTRVRGLSHFRVIGLADNVASITAYANDEGYENIFSQQLVGMMKQGDVVIGISTSGKSPNVLKAIEYANRNGGYTIGLTGFNGGQLGEMVNLHIHVPSNRIEQVEDIHLMIEHMVISAIKDVTQNDSFVTQITNIFAKNDTVREMRSAINEPTSRPIRSTFDLISSINTMMETHTQGYDLLHKVLQMTVESIGASSGSFLVIDEEGNITHGLLAYGGKIQASLKKELTDVFKGGLAGWVVQNQQAVLVADTREDERWLPRDWEDKGSDSRSVISVPLIAQKRVTGLLTLARHNGEQFTEADLSLLTSVAIFLSFRVFNQVE
jgi:D-sedoheptulose 7-phosphate isomerase